MPRDKKIEMAAPIFHVIQNLSKKSRILDVRNFIRLNSFQHLNIHTADNDSRNNRDKESKYRTHLKYNLVIAGIISSGSIYIWYKWKDEILDGLFNCTIKKIPTVSAKSISNKDISGNRFKFNFIADVVEITAPSVVCIETRSEDQRRIGSFAGRLSPSRNGSGFIIGEDGLILTNAHVVANEPDTIVRVRLYDGSTYMGKVEDVDIQSDLATVRINKTDLPVMKLGNSASTRPGEFVVAIGSPYTLDNTIVSGVVSSVHRQGQEFSRHHRHMEYIQTDVAITFGNSGGPLVNLSGEAIGINTMMITVGISFAIPIDHAKEFLKKSELRRINKGQLESEDSSKHVKRRYLGITMLTLTPSIFRELQPIYGILSTSDTMQGVLVVRVDSNSPASIGGLKPGDIIMNMNDKALKETGDIYKLLETPGALILNVYRHGEMKKIRIDPEEFS